MFKIKVATNMASTTRCELLTKGQIGAQVQFVFNDHWSDMKKTAVFKRCGKTIDVVDSEWNGDIVTVPSEMTEEAGLQVYVGVYGVSEDGKRITPTLYAPLGTVALGAEPDGDPSTDPTLPVWAQLQAQIGDLSNLTTEDKTSLVAAINEAAKSGGGSGGGKDGTGIESITYKGEDESGGNMYTVLLTDGTSYDITAPKGAKGDKGDAGGKGVPGKAATIQVGNVTTGAAGTPASVSNVGTDESAVFDFSIPRGDKGADGADGADGITPHIGDNGNWYLGSTDTGKPSRGETGLQGPVGPVGPQGPQGEKGVDGKTPVKGTDYWTAADKQEIIDDIHSAYYIDLEGKYPNYTCSVAMGDIKAAYNSGYNLVCRCTLGVYTATLPLFVPMPDFNTWIFSGSGALTAMNFPAQMLTIAIVNGKVQASNTRLASMDDIPTIPTALKNPNALTVKIGSTTVTYDGSSAQTVEIADGTEVSY